MRHNTFLVFTLPTYYLTCQNAELASIVIAYLTSSGLIEYVLVLLTSGVLELFSPRPDVDFSILVLIQIQPSD